MTARRKIFWQFWISTIAGLLLFLPDPYGLGLHHVYIPFLGSYSLGVFYLPLAILTIIAMSNAVNITDGKSYSFYMSGFYNTTSKSVEAFVVEDAYPPDIDWTVAIVRFVNAISNANPMTLYAKSSTTGTEVAVGGSIAYKAAGAFVTLPGGSYDLSTRYAGSSTNAITRTAVSFSAGRVYTISARGDITITSTTATNRPFLDNTANR